MIVALTLLRRFWWAVPIALLLALYLRADHLRAGYKDALASTIARYEAAQKTAQADFDKQRAADKAHNDKANDHADTQNHATQLIYRDRVVRLPAAPASCAAGGTGLPTANDAKSTDGPSADAIVSIKRDDAMICAINQSRLEAAHAWAIEMEGAR